MPEGGRSSEASERSGFLPVLRRRRLCQTRDGSEPELFGEVGGLDSNTLADVVVIRASSSGDDPGKPAGRNETTPALANATSAEST